ncbi:hypothetical protein ACQ859_05365 [Roseateles chitinivorans]|uniref:hypothetical protein n=1 Tax=Roseateles chitinivorans TaxID=2917965 RepID=UPI003D6752EE
MSFHPDQLNPRLGGYEVIDCEIKDRGVLYLLMREDVDQMEVHRRGRGGPPEGRMAKRLIGLRLDEPERPVGVAHVAGLGTSHCAMAFAPEGKVAIVDSDSKVWMQSDGGSPFQPRLPFKSEGGVLTGGLSRVRSFGAELIACTTSRQMLVRRGPGDWQFLGDPIPDPGDRAMSFEDFDRFAADDLYAVGAPGDVWHFNGTVWRRCRFPSDWGLSAVCCGGDGNVYIAAGHTIFRGQGDRWERLRTRGTIALPIQDLVWYEDRLWAATHVGLFVLDGDTLRKADEVPNQIYGHHLAVRDGVMLMGSPYGAAFRRDGEWTQIFSQYDTRTWYAENKDQAWKPVFKAPGG